MDYILEKQSVQSTAVLLDTVVEQLVDFDLTLPDYCPDIRKIHKCMLTPKIFSKSISGGQLLVDGSAEVRVIYCEGVKNTLRCCEQPVPFTASFPLKGSSELCMALVNTKTEYINCRALSTRRLVIHGAFSLYAKVISKSTAQLFAPAENTELQTKLTSVECMRLAAFCAEDFSLSDEVALSGRPPVESLLKSSVSISSCECKVIPSKLLINGELDVKLLYLSDLDTGKTENIDCVLPFSHIIDCEGAAENQASFFKACVSAFDIRLKNDSGDTPSVTVEAKISFSYIGRERLTCSVITDAYSVDCLTDIQTSSVTLLRDACKVKDSLMHKLNLPLGDEELSEVCDIFSEYCTVTPFISEESLTLSGKLNICIFAKAKDGSPLYIERTTDFKQVLSAPVHYNTVSEYFAEVSSISYRLTESGEIELRIEIKNSACLELRETIKLVSAASSIEDKPLKRGDSALTVYFASKGESVWEIAKHYRCKYKDMLSENSIETEFLGEPRILLVPLI